MPILPNFVEIDQTVAKISRFNGFFFKNGRRRHFGFLENSNFSRSIRSGDTFYVVMPNFVEMINPCRDIAIFRFSKMTAVHRLGFVEASMRLPRKSNWWS